MRLVDVVLRQMARAADQIDMRFWDTWQDEYFDDIEAEVDIRPVQEPKPGKRAADDQPLLLFIHGIRGIAVVVPAPRLYLYKDQRIGSALPANQIHFAPARCAVVAIEDLISVSLEVSRRQPLPSPAEFMRRVPFAVRAVEAPAEPAGKIGDGLRKDRKPANAEDGARFRILCV